jgi:hypothetical protein
MINASTSVTLAGIFFDTTTNVNTVDYSLASAQTVYVKSVAGTVDISSGSPNVVGTGTAFLTQLSVGSKVYISSVEYTVLSIADNTNLTLTTNAGATLLSQPIKTNSYHNLTLSSSGVKTLTNLTNIAGDFNIIGAASATTAANFRIGGNLTLNSTAVTPLTIGTFTFTVNGTTTITNGYLVHNASAFDKTYNGMVTIASTGKWYDYGTPIFFHGGLTNNSATVFTAGTSMYTFDTNPQTVDGTSLISIPNITITGITLTNNNSGGLTVTASLQGGGGITQGGSGVLNIGVADTSLLTGPLNASAAGNTVNYTGIAQTVKPVTYYNLTLSGSGIPSLAGVGTINGNFTLTGAVVPTVSSAMIITGNLTINAASANLHVGGNAFTVTGTTTITTGTLTFDSAAGLKTFTGDVTVTGTWTESADASFSFGGNLINNGIFTAFTTGTPAGVHTFTGSGKTLGVSGKTLIIPNITVSGTYNNKGTLTVNVALAGAGTLTQFDSAATLKIGGTSGISGLVASAVGNTVEYTGLAAQTVKVTTYHHLTLSGATNQPLGVTTINGNLTLSGTVAPTTSAVLTVSGDVTLSGTAAPVTGNIMTIGRNLLISGGSLTVGAFDFTVNGTTNVAAGSLIFSADPTNIKTFTGAVTVIGTWTNTNSNIHLKSAMTGTVAVTNGSALVRGTGTAFATQLSAGSTSIVDIASAVYTVSNVNLTGTVTATNGSATLTGAGTAFTTEAAAGDKLYINSVQYTVLSVGSATSLTLTAPYAETTAAGLTIKSDNLLRLTGNYTSATASGLTLTSGLTTGSASTFTSGSGTYFFDTNAGTNTQMIYGGRAVAAKTTIANISVSSGVTLTNNSPAANSVAINGVLGGLGAFKQGVNAQLNLEMANANTGITITGFDVTTNVNTVDYSLAGIQTIKSVAYHHLTLSNTSAKTMLAGLTTVNGNLTLSGTASATTADTLAVGGDVTLNNTAALTTGNIMTIGRNLLISGGSLTVGAFDFTVNGTTTVATGSLIFNSDAVNIKTLTGAVTVNGTWTNTNSNVHLKSGMTGTVSVTNGSALVRGTGTAFTTQLSETSTSKVDIASVVYTVSNVNLTGTVTATSGSATLAGVGTAFTTEVAAGDKLYINSVQYTVLSVASTTSLTLTTPYVGTTTPTLTVKSDNLLRLTGNYTGTTASGLTLISGLTTGSASTFTSGSGTYFFDANGGANTQMVYGGRAVATKTTIANISVSSTVTLINDSPAANSIAINGTLGGAGTFKQGANTQLNLEMTFANTGITVATFDMTTNAANTVDYSLAGAQTAKGVPYSNLTLSNSGLKTMTGLTTVTGNMIFNGSASSTTLPNNLAITGSLTFNTTSTATLPSGMTVGVDLNINGTAVATLGGDVTVSGKTKIAGGTLALSTFNLNVGGDWEKTTGTFTPGTGTVTFNGAGAQKITSGAGYTATAFNNLTINKASGGLSLDATTAIDTTVNGALTLTSGIITTNARFLIIGSSGTLSGGNAISYVIGNLRKTFPAASGQSFTFALGDAVGGYSPLSLSSLNVGTAGYITATITVGGHTQIGTSGLDATYTANRYWTMSTSGSTIAVTGYNAAFAFENDQYLQNVTPAVDPTAFVARQYQAGWTSPTTGTVTSVDLGGGVIQYSVPATGFTTIGTTSDFVVGERPHTAITGVSAISDTYGNTITLFATLSAGGNPYPAQTLTFKLNGHLVNTAITDINGVAMLSGVLLDENAGSYPGGVTATFADNGTYGAGAGSANLTVAPKPITVSAVTDTKTYDGTTASSSVPIMTGTLVIGDSIGTPWTQSFDSKVVGARTLTPSGAISDGNGGNNYTVTYVNASGTINQKVVTLTGSSITADSRPYDGTRNATLTVVSPALSGVVPGDIVILGAYGGTFDTRNVGTGKTVTATAAFTGADAANYVYNSAHTLTANITKANITVTATTQTKTYDGTTASSSIPTITSGSLGAGDTASWTQVFDSKNAGARTLTPSGTVSDGNSGGNYTIAFANTAGTISQKPVTVTAVTQTKEYDATTASSGVPTITSGSLITGDTAAWSQSFDSKDVGSRTLTPTGTITDGNSGGNYIVTFASTAGTINKKDLTVTAQNNIISTSVPPYTYVVTGFVTGEDATLIDTPPTCSLIPGVYPPAVYPNVIQCAGGLDNNYGFVYVHGSLTVVAQTVNYASDSKNDGYILESGETTNVGSDTVDSSGPYIYLGDDAAKKQYLGILSFKTYPQPDSKFVINTVTLKIRYNSLTSGFATPGALLKAFGGFMVDIKKGFFGTKMTLAKSDFQSKGNKILAPKTTSAKGYYSLNLSSLKAQINNLSKNSGVTQIKLRFKLDDNNNALADIMKIYSGNAKIPAYRPTLTITYYLTP